jgi:hypothetical protein
MPVPGMEPYGTGMPGMMRPAQPRKHEDPSEESTRPPGRAEERGRVATDPGELAGLEERLSTVERSRDQIKARIRIADHAALEALERRIESLHDEILRLRRGNAESEDPKLKDLRQRLRKGVERLEEAKSLAPDDPLIPSYEEQIKALRDEIRKRFPDADSVPNRADDQGACSLSAPSTLGAMKDNPVRFGPEPVLPRQGLLPNAFGNASIFSFHIGVFY